MQVVVIGMGRLLTNSVLSGKPSITYRRLQVMSRKAPTQLVHCEAIIAAQHVVTIVPVAAMYVDVVVLPIVTVVVQMQHMR